MKRLLHKNKKAVTLVGLLIAATILSFVIIPFYLAFQATRRGTSKSLNSLIGANVAAAIMEKYKAKTFIELESLMLKLGSEQLQNSTRYINGPFQSDPPEPSVLENEVHRAGNVIFNGAITLSYFPQPNPNPDDPSFQMLRKRMKIQVDVSWNERNVPGQFLTHHFTCTTMVHDEKFASKPSFANMGYTGVSP